MNLSAVLMGDFELSAEAVGDAAMPAGADRPESVLTALTASPIVRQHSDPYFLSTPPSMSVSVLEPEQQLSPHLEVLCVKSSAASSATLSPGRKQSGSTTASAAVVSVSIMPTTDARSSLLDLGAAAESVLDLGGGTAHQEHSECVHSNDLVEWDSPVDTRSQSDEFSALIMDSADHKFTEPGQSSRGGKMMLNNKYLVDPALVIGRGTFATVYEGVRLADDGRVAIKCIIKAMVFSVSERLAIAQEVKVLQDMRDTPGVVCLLDVYETPKHIWMIMERHETSLFAFLKDSDGSRCSERLACTTTRKLLGVLDVMHSQMGVLHCDIKPHNVLVNVVSAESIDCTLIDFGVCLKMDSSQRAENTGMRGTTAFIAPEVRGGYDYTPATDIYSLGVSLFQMLLGQRAPAADALHRLYGVCDISFIPAEVHADFALLFGTVVELSDEAKSFVTWMLHPNPNYRGTIQQLLAHPWLREEEPTL